MTASNPKPRTVPSWLAEDRARQERWAWKPTPAVYAAFKVRDLELARSNMKLAVGEHENTLHNLLTFARAKALEEVKTLYYKARDVELNRAA